MEYTPLPNGIYYATKEGNLIELGQLEQTEETIVGVAVIDEKCKFIVKGYSAALVWSTENEYISEIPDITDEETLITDFDGQAHTQAMNNGDTSGAGYIVSNMTITFGDKTLTGYLGAGGEWQVVIDNIRIINGALSAAFRFYLIHQSSTYYYWTSNEYSNSSAWYVSINSYGLTTFSTRSKTLEDASNHNELIFYPLEF